MPTLHWVGKDKVKHHHRDVPYRVLTDEHQYQAPAGTPSNSTDNRIIQGDNLEALKSLLPEFEGKVQCIYIDPPYNTGNESWVYNDNVNDPRIKKWLGQVVGKEGEDMSRHDKWLCMMYPRLKLLHRLLAEDGAIFISIDDIEHAHLRLICDEIFGRQNFVANLVWQSKDTPGNNASGVAQTHNHILAFRKSSDLSINLLSRTEKQLGTYSNPDEDHRGPWLAAPLTRVEHRDRDFYAICNKAGREVFPPNGSSWRRPPKEMQKLAEDNRIWWGKEGDSNFPMEKKFLSEAKEGVVNQSWWPYQFAGSTRNASAEMKAIFAGIKPFDTPKPSRLIERLLEIATSKNAVILDSFAGSGTTAHATLKLNAQDGGNRRFILIEMMDYADSLTAERVRRVMAGYGEGDKAVAGLGGGYVFQELGEPLFDVERQLNPAVPLQAVRDYIAWQECIPRDAQAPVDNPRHRYWLGEANGQQVFFCYEPQRITCLDLELLAELLQSPAPTLFYADQLALGEDFMRTHKLRFKKIPRDISRL